MRSIKKKGLSKGCIVLPKGTTVRNIKYKRKRRNQKGGVYFADRVLKSAENFFNQRGKGFVNKYIGDFTDHKTGKKIPDRVIWSQFKKQIRSVPRSRRRSFW